MVVTFEKKAGIVRKTGHVTGKICPPLGNLNNIAIFIQPIRIFMEVFPHGEMELPFNYLLSAFQLTCVVASIQKKSRLTLLIE